MPEIRQMEESVRNPDNLPCVSGFLTGWIFCIITNKKGYVIVQVSVNKAVGTLNDTSGKGVIIWLRKHTDYLRQACLPEQERRQ